MYRFALSEVNPKFSPIFEKKEERNMNWEEAKFEKYVEHLIQEEARSIDELAAAKEKLARVQGARDFMEWLAKESGKESNSSGEDLAENRIMLRLRSIQTSTKRSHTQREALREIAQMQKGVVNASKAGKLIMKAGLGKGKVQSTISTLHRYLTEGEEWEYIEPGTFRLKDFKDDGTEPVVMELGSQHENEHVALT